MHTENVPPGSASILALTQARGNSQSEPKSTPPPVAPATFPLFYGLPESDIRTMLDAGNAVQYPPRSWLYEQGESARHFFLVESGLVRLSQLTPEGHDILVRFIKPGEVLGYFALTPGGVNVASARVIRSSRVAMWEHDVLLRLLQSIPRAALNLLNIAVRDVVYFYDHTRRLLTQDVGHRVEWALSELARTIGVSTSEGLVIAQGIGQRELAELAGTTIFTVSRELTKLQRQGILEKRRGCIIVVQPQKLSEW